jgi:hypothetical protein
VSRLVTTPPSIYATDSETSAAGFLTNTSASSTYLAQSSASSTYQQISNEPTIFRNAVINGDFSVWQRGTSFTDLTAGNFYGPDRWGFNRSGDVSGLIISRSTDAPTGFIYSVKNQRTSGNTNTAGLSTYYSVESANSKRFAGKPVTFSFYAKSGANYSGGALSYGITSGTGTDQRVYAFTSRVDYNNVVNLTSSWQRFSGTTTFLSDINQVGFNFAWTPTGTAGADDSIYITGVQLEEGTQSTPFEFRPYGVELSLCQRYFEWTEFFTTNWNNATNTARTGVNWLVAKRRSPDVSLTSGYNQYGPGGQLTITSISSVTSNSGGALFTFSQSGGLTTNHPSTSSVALKVDGEL